MKSRGYGFIAIECSSCHLQNPDVQSCTKTMFISAPTPYRFYLRDVIRKEVPQFELRDVLREARGSEKVLLPPDSYRLREKRRAGPLISENAPSTNTL